MSLGDPLRDSATLIAQPDTHRRLTPPGIMIIGDEREAQVDAGEPLGRGIALLLNRARHQASKKS